MAHQDGGFLIAPILYMLALAGIGASVMFSGYSQILRSNAEIAANNAARQQLNSAGQTLSASSTLDVATSTILQPPAALAFAAVSDAARLPDNYATVNSTGTPTTFGVVDVSSGVRQLDPWGKYYLYCRWENGVAAPASPSIMVISGGPDGALQTKCGDATGQGDDRINKLTIAEAINRANVWQVNSASQIKFGVAADSVKVNDDGSMQAASLILSTPLAVASGGTGGATAALARSNLAVLSIASNLSDLADAPTARTNMGLGTMATQNASAVAITGGTISGVTVTGSGASLTSIPLSALTTTGTASASTYLRGDGQWVSIAHQWSDGASGAIYYNSGNVGIGTTSPSQALDVIGNITASGSIMTGLNRPTTTGSAGTYTSSAVATCSVGTSIIGGGCNESNAGCWLYRNNPGTTSSWQCNSYSIAGAGCQVTAHAICARIQ